MATIITAAGGEELADLYRGYDRVTVGPGTFNPNIYSTSSYARKKTYDLMIGQLSSAVYGGADNDPTPLAIPFSHSVQFNAVYSWNLHYLPVRDRIALLSYILRANQNRIRDNLPMLIDYHAVKRAIPVVQGCTRLYKLPLIRVRETYPLVEWEDIVRKSGLQWQNHYKEQMKKRR